MPLTLLLNQETPERIRFERLEEVSGTQKLYRSGFVYAKLVGMTRTEEFVGGGVDEDGNPVDPTPVIRLLAEVEITKMNIDFLLLGEFYFDLRGLRYEVQEYAASKDDNGETVVLGTFLLSASSHGKGGSSQGLEIDDTFLDVVIDPADRGARILFGIADGDGGLIPAIATARVKRTLGTHQEIGQDVPYATVVTQQNQIVRKKQDKPDNTGDFEPSANEWVLTYAARKSFFQGVHLSDLNDVFYVSFEKMSTSYIGEDSLDSNVYPTFGDSDGTPPTWPESATPVPWNIDVTRPSGDSKFTGSKFWIRFNKNEKGEISNSIAPVFVDGDAYRLRTGQDKSSGVVVEPIWDALLGITGLLVLEDGGVLVKGKQFLNLFSDQNEMQNIYPRSEAEQLLMNFAWDHRDAIFVGMSAAAEGGVVRCELWH